MGDRMIASEPVRGHVADLVRREKAEGLTAEESAELDRYLRLEHRMRMVKARAKGAPAAGLV